jgi:hypothetical protein
VSGLPVGGAPEPPSGGEDAAVIPHFRCRNSGINRDPDNRKSRSLKLRIQMPQQPPEQNIQIKITDDVMKGFYSNLMQVMHSKEEFVLDFMNVVGQQGIVGSRVSVSPGHFKRIVAAFTENVK